MKMNFEMPLIRITKFGGENVRTDEVVTVSAMKINAYGMQSFTTLKQVQSAIKEGSPATKEILQYQY